MKQNRRIEIGTSGFGEASAATVEERARQIARSDGRTKVNNLDRQEARREILDPILDEGSPEEQIFEDDRPEAGVAPASAGTQEKRVPLDDESNIPEDLVREGVEEADFDTRVQSGKPREL
jgi:hypothetical protein